MSLNLKSNAQGSSPNDLYGADISQVIKRANANAGSNSKDIDLSRLGDYTKLANQKGGSTWGTTRSDFNKLFTDYNLASSSTNELSIDNINSTASPDSLMKNTDYKLGYGANSKVSSTAKDFLTQMQSIFENRKQEILNRYQRPGGAQTDVKQ